MSKSTSYNFSLLDPDLTNTFPTSAPNVLAGFNTNYSDLMPGGSSSSYFGSGFDLSSIPKEDRGLAIFAAMSDPTRQTQAMVDAFTRLNPLLLEQAKEQQKLGIQSNLWGAAIKSIAELPKTITESFAEGRRGRLAGQQAILNQQQRPYNIGGFSMPYNTYRV